MNASGRVPVNRERAVVRVRWPSAVHVFKQKIELNSLVIKKDRTRQEYFVRTMVRVHRS
jgi:hypothetical protein